MPRDGRFGWDNEYGVHTVEVPAFEIDAYPVTNARYLAFVEAGGYRDPSLWSEGDWAWRTSSGIEHPSF